MKKVNLKISSAGGSTWNYTFRVFNDGDVREEMVDSVDPCSLDTDEAFEFFDNLIESNDDFAETTSVGLRFNGWCTQKLWVSVDGSKAQAMVIPPFEYMADINDLSTINMPDGIPDREKNNYTLDLHHRFKIDVLTPNPLPDMGYVDLGFDPDEDADEDFDNKASDLGKVPGLLTATCYVGESEFEIKLADDEVFDPSKLRLAAYAHIGEDTILGAQCVEEYDLICADAIVYDGKWYPALKQTGFCECPYVNIVGVELKSYDLEDEEEAEEGCEISEVQRIAYSTGDYYGDFPSGVKAWGVDVGDSYDDEEYDDEEYDEDYDDEDYEEE